ncbi:tetratricopeptide repeat protein [Roseivirga sp. 4D4]|uniref:tetratricopeptide repeat protein n=1 Tax=Roseivirga sp. 4D4 TaxID=1889784 RepID=UPI00147F0876|nr:hypothetical protein [Roseivirga sp. 4D4]
MFKIILVGGACGLIMAFIYFRQTRPINILEEFEKLREQPIQSKSGEQLAEYYVNVRKIDSLLLIDQESVAIDFLKNLADTASHHVQEYLFNMGKILYGQGDFNRAQLTFSRVLNEYDKDHINAREWRAYCFMQFKDCDLAMKDARYLVEYDSAFLDKYERIKQNCDSIESQVE